MKLIKVNVLKEWVENWFTKNRFYHPYAKNNNIPITELYDILEQLPSAQPEQKRGKWLWLSSTYDRRPCEMRFMCSECHHETILHSNKTSYPWENFCPNCGADMRGEEHE